MKVLHVPYGYYPDPAGGTEAYVAALARALRGFDVGSIVAAPAEASRTYVHERARVRRFAVAPTVLDVRELYGEGDPCAAREFGVILDEERPDVVHFHAFTRGASLLAVREAKRRGMPVAFTYHTPAVSCVRGTLLRWGSEVCDGVLRVGRCASCALHGKGAGRVSSTLLGRTPRFIGMLAGAAGLAGRAWTALRMTELMHRRHSAFQALMEEVDRVIAPCMWAREVLERNDVPAGKIHLSRQGVDGSAFAGSPDEYEGGGELRMAFLGRLDPAKGIDLMIDAIRRAPGMQVRLDIYGVAQGESGDGWHRRLRDLAAGDLRIDFQESLAVDAIPAALRKHHLVVVPSQGMETGPLVVLEAFAAGVPVVATALGGIGELVSHEVDGLLIPPRSFDGWRAALARFRDEPALHRRLRAGIRPPRTMNDAAADMKEVYRALARTA